MRRKKEFTKAKGSYYFNIIAGYNNTITISRDNKSEAIHAFSNYLKQKKDCQWLGLWNGDKFEQTDFAAVKA